MSYFYYIKSKVRESILGKIEERANKQTNKQTIRGGEEEDEEKTKEGIDVQMQGGDPDWRLLSHVTGDCVFRLGFMRCLKKKKKR